MKFRLHTSFIGYLLILCLFSSVHTVLSLLASLLIHEGAHVLVSMLFKEPIECVELSPIGGMITYQAGHSPSKGVRGVLISVAGPLANYGCIYLSAAFTHANVPPEFVKAWIQSNLSLRLMNLIPALPLDGGNLLLSVGVYIFPTNTVIKTLCFLGLITGIGLCALALYGFVAFGMLNLTLPLIGLYLVVTSKGQRDTLLSQNMYAVIYEQPSTRLAIQDVNLFSVEPNTSLLELAKVVSRTESALFVYENENGQIHWFGRKSVCRAFLRSPEGSIQSLIASAEKKKQKE